MNNQYLILERILESISLHLDVEPCHLLEYIQALPKPQEFADLQARVDCLLKENSKLKTKVEEGKALWKEMVELKDRITTLEEEVKTALEEQNKAKAKEVARKIHSFMGFLGEVVNKARLYDQGLRQPETALGAKMMRCMVDYSTKMEKLLKELCTLLDPNRNWPPHRSQPQDQVRYPFLSLVLALLLLRFLNRIPYAIFNYFWTVRSPEIRNHILSI